VKELWSADDYEIEIKGIVSTSDRTKLLKLKSIG
jgi:hypothetical protein